MMRSRVNYKYGNDKCPGNRKAIFDIKTGEKAEGNLPRDKEK
jgi:hypothetical protein